MKKKIRNQRESEYDLLKHILKREQFVFPIGESNYLMGETVCRQCTDQEMKLFSEFVDVYDRTKKLNEKTFGHLKKKDLEPIVRFLESLRFGADKVFSDEDKSTIKNSIWEKIKHLSDSDNIALSNRVKMFIQCLEWKDRYTTMIMVERTNEE